MTRTLVMKFGGSSLADTEKIGAIADIVARRRREGVPVVVVVSAMGKTTDGLIGQAREFSQRPDLREMDMLLTAGERVSAALVAIALNARGVRAVSLTGSQAGIITDDAHTNARIIEVRPFRVKKALDEGCIVVVGGFQGVSFAKEVTTLGRGGSDVSAVALAAALGAAECEIYSDVTGVYAADPRIVKDPERIAALGYQEMQELAEAGAKVLHPKAVEFAKPDGIAIHCKNTFEPEAEGTIIADLEGRIKPRVVGIATEERVVMVGVRAGDAMVMEAIRFAEKSGLRIKQISFHQDDIGAMNGSFIVPEKENYHLDQVLEELTARFGAATTVRRDLSAISLVGAGITERHEFLGDAVAILRDSGIGIGSIHTSSFRISMLIDRGRLADAARLFYDRFITP